MLGPIFFNRRQKRMTGQACMWKLGKVRSNAKGGKFLCIELAEQSFAGNPMGAQGLLQGAAPQRELTNERLRLFWSGPRPIWSSSWRPHPSASSTQSSCPRPCASGDGAVAVSTTQEMAPKASAPVVTLLHSSWSQPTCPDLHAVQVQRARRLLPSPEIEPPKAPKCSFAIPPGDREVQARRAPEY